MKLLKVVLLAVLVVGLSSCKDDQYDFLEDGVYADVQTSKGNVLIELNYEEVPMTVGNFVSLAEGTNLRVVDSMKGKPYYDGLNFHRVISTSNGDKNDFMVQGGCPLGTGTGDPGYSFADEFPKDSVGNLLLKHDQPGVLSMANSGPATNGSQFFITIVPTPHLDGRHTVFGHVIKGQELVKDSIKKGDKIVKITIVKVGTEAKKFDGYKTFNDALLAEEKKKAELEAKMIALKADFAAKMETYKAQAETLPSGLKIYFEAKGDGPKPGVGADILFDYSVYFTDGNLLDSNSKEVAQAYNVYNSQRDQQGGYKAFPTKYSMEGQFIQGFSEGMQQLKFGDVAYLFIPSHLGYGEQGTRGVPPNTDLIFKLQIYPKN